MNVLLQPATGTGVDESRLNMLKGTCKGAQATEKWNSNGSTVGPHTDGHGRTGCELRSAKLSRLLATAPKKEGPDREKWRTSRFPIRRNVG